MALFGFGKKDTGKTPSDSALPAEKETGPGGAAAVKDASPPVVRSASRDSSHILRNPRITEKATFVQGSGAYVFDVDERATKRQIVGAITSLYNVTPRNVRIIRVRAKQVQNMRTGRRGVKSGGKKAYVFLKKGDSITIT